MATLALLTSLGTIAIKVHDDRAPATAAYVRALAEGGRYDGAEFYRRTTLGEPGRRPLVQGGPMAPMFLGTGDRPPDLPLLSEIEGTEITGLTHRRGTVSLGRDLFETGHALPELFLCLDDYPDLDASGRTEPDAIGFPAFGTVTKGLDVVETIAASATEGTSPFDRLTGEVLTEPVLINSAWWVED